MPLFGSSKSGFTSSARKKHWFLRLLCVLILLCGLYIIITKTLPSSWSINSDIMLPRLPSGSRVLVLPYIRRPMDRLKRPPKRGDVVVLTPPYVPQIPWYAAFLDTVVRFFTFQKLSIQTPSDSAAGQQQVFKRIVGIPGDTIRIRNFEAQIKPPDAFLFHSEFEESSRNYDLKIDPLPSGWDNDLPLSGSMGEIVLENNEYFVLSDNRSSSSDSRSWGPIKESAIQGRAFLIYWPFSAFGWLR